MSRSEAIRSALVESARRLRRSAELAEEDAELQADEADRTEMSAVAQLVLVAPTSQSARPATIRPEIEIVGDRMRVLVEQVGAADPSRLGDIAGHLTPEEIWGVDEALFTVLDLR